LNPPNKNKKSTVSGYNPTAEGKKPEFVTDPEIVLFLIICPKYQRLYSVRHLFREGMFTLLE